MLLTAWIAILICAYMSDVTVERRRDLQIASMVGMVHGLFCMFSILASMLTDRNRGFWVGCAVFGSLPMLLASATVPLNAYPSPGRIFMEFIDQSVAADNKAFNTYVMHHVRILDIAIASVITLSGGLLGWRMGQSTE